MEPRFETVQADAASSFRCLWYTCRSFAENHTWHYHPEFELIWVVRGHGTRFVGDNIESYHPGDLVLTGPNMPHCWHSDAEVGGHPPEAAVVQFRPEMFGHDFLDLPEFEQIKRLFRASKCGLHIEGETAEQVQAQMRSLFERKGIARLIGLLDILRVLAETEHDVRYLASADYHITNDITELNRHRIEMIHRHVRQNLSSEINQADVARLVGLTPPAFSRFFRRATGQTFVGFVNILRINEVCREMTEGNDCITNIAMNCGYNNIANFNRQFLALKGMNPSQYREQHLRMKQNATTFHS
ncbi:MAG: AraC family transcriptional regulator [Proteobacteria bacterium]|nr:AraC family transcriptional regulator [Pseudomonadota bacterium]